MLEFNIDASLHKEEKYQLLLAQIAALLDGETNTIASISNAIAAVHNTMSFLWTGLYFVSENNLYLAMFQGTVACTKIAYNKGVCGTSLAKKETIIVDNVELFDGHIACSSLSKSEIVIPIFDDNNNVVAVFDIDSEFTSNFNNTDELYLTKLLGLIHSSIILFAKANY